MIDKGKAIVIMCCLAALVSGAAEWVSYPGDYALWKGNDLQSRRIEHGGPYPVFWASYAPHPLVEFVKTVKLSEPEEVEIASEGKVFITLHPDRTLSVVSNRVTFPAGHYTVFARVCSQGRPPALFLRGRTLSTGGDWTVDWRMAGAGAEREDALPVQVHDGFDDPLRRPAETTLPTVRRPAKATSVSADGILADFGRESFGFVRLVGVRGRGRVRIVYGESREEAEDRRPDGPDQWELVEADGAEEMRAPCSRGFRYVTALPEDGVTVGGIEMDEEPCPVARIGDFVSSDEELNRIWQVSARTLELTTRELMVEGAKRDRWIWSGDVRQCCLMGYCLFADQRIARDTLFCLRGGDPVVMHLNGIMDYSFYYFLAVEEYFLHTGDRTFLRQIQPRLRTLVDFILSRLDAEGRPRDRPNDWIFVDWAKPPLPNAGGVVSFEQMLLVEALEAFLRVNAELALPEDVRCRQLATRLRNEIIPRYWDESRGGLLHLMRDDGTLDDRMTRYPNLFGLVRGYFDEAKKNKVLANVIFNDAVAKISTPYMRFYELDALCGLGRHAEVLKDVKSYWGGMLKEGATSFWELYDPAEKGLAKYAMYGRPFGKSLCHAWGANPVYLLGRRFLGVRPTAPGFGRYEVRPVLGGLKWMKGRVPTPSGVIDVSVDGTKVSVKGNAGEGTLYWNNGIHRIAPGACVEITD